MSCEPFTQGVTKDNEACLQAQPGPAGTCSLWNPLSLPLFPLCSQEVARAPLTSASLLSLPQGRPSSAFKIPLLGASLLPTETQSPSLGRAGVG